MKLTFIVPKIKIICKMGSFIHLLKCLSAEIVEKNKSEHESDQSGMKFFPSNCQKSLIHMVKKHLTHEIGRVLVLFPCILIDEQR